MSPAFPTTTKSPFPYATFIILCEVSDVREVQVIPSDDVKIVPELPKTT